MYHAITKGKTCAAPPVLGRIGDERLRNPWMGGLRTTKITQATVVDISNVATYYFETAPKAVWTLNEDFRGVTPPFPLMFFEFPPIRREYSFTRKVWDELNEAKELLGYGVLVQRRDVRPEYIKYHKDERDINVIIPKYAHNWFSPHAGKETTVSVKEHQLNARWNVRMWSLVHLRDLVLGPLAINDFFLDEKGDVMIHFPALGMDPERERDAVTTKSFTTYPEGMTDEQKREWLDTTMPYHRLLDVAFLALSFMNCRNVTMREVQPPPLKKKQIRRGDVPRVTHRVIEITPMKPRVVSTRAADPNTIALDASKRSFHIVRGHFKHFGPDYGTKKLFGRVSGKFWWDKHTAGSIDAGLSESDYSVKV